jgi:hypothetical protein
MQGPASGSPSQIGALIYFASMSEIIHSAPWQPWQKSATMPAALLQRIEMPLLLR